MPAARRPPPIVYDHIWRQIAEPAEPGKRRSNVAVEEEIGYSRPMQPLPLNQRLDRIGQHIVRARLFLDLWFYFEGDSRRKIIEIMQEFASRRTLTSSPM